jgi:hypothetical protein
MTFRGLRSSIPLNSPAAPYSPTVIATVRAPNASPFDLSQAPRRLKIRWVEYLLLLSWVTVKVVPKDSRAKSRLDSARGWVRGLGCEKPGGHIFAPVLRTRRRPRSTRSWSLYHPPQTLVADVSQQRFGTPHHVPGQGAAAEVLQAPRARAGQGGCPCPLRVPRNLR